MIAVLLKWRFATVCLFMSILQWTTQFQPSAYDVFQRRCKSCAHRKGGLDGEEGVGIYFIFLMGGGGGGGWGGLHFLIHHGVNETWCWCAVR